MKPLRIAIIGFGRIAADQHLHSIAADGRLELVATVDGKTCGLKGVAHFTNHIELLDAGLDIDAVVITTPPSDRYNIACACLEAGLHCMLEKPPTITIGHIERLSDLALRKQITLFTAWHAQYNRAVAAAAEALAGKRIASMHIIWHEHFRKWHPDQQWIWRPGGFGVFDAGVNALSIAIKIFPGILLVDDANLMFPSNRSTPIAANIGFASPMADGKLTASLHWHSAKEEWTIEVETVDGLLVKLKEGGSKLEINGKVEIEGNVGEYPSLYSQYIDLIDTRLSYVDVAPLRLTADVFLIGERSIVEAVNDGIIGGAAASEGEAQMGPRPSIFSARP